MTTRGNRARRLASQATSMAEGIFTPYSQMADNPADDPSIYEMEDEVDDEDSEDEDSEGEEESNGGECMGCMKRSMAAMKAGDKAKAMSELKGAMSAYMKAGKKMCGDAHMKAKRLKGKPMRSVKDKYGS